MKTSTNDLKHVLTDETAACIRLTFALPNLPPQIGNPWEIIPGANQIELIQGDSIYIAIAATPEKDAAKGKWVATRIAAHPDEREPKDRSWPRYYFDRSRGKHEIEEWMIYNGQLRGRIRSSQSTPQNNNHR